MAENLEINYIICAIPLFPFVGSLLTLLIPIDSLLRQDAIRLSLGFPETGTSGLALQPGHRTGCHQHGSRTAQRRTAQDSTARLAPTEGQ